MKLASLFISAALLFATAACQSSQIRILGEPIGPNERSLGAVESRSTGFMLFNFIPINQNDRFQKAYGSVVAKSGGTRLTDVTISERWFWTPVGNGFSFRVQGEGVANK
jgi:hypothetical protein